MDGHEVTFGLDNNKDAIETFAKNHPKATVSCIDVEDLQIEELPDADIIVGGPPCVNFSSSKGSRANVLEGLKLVQAFLRLVWVKKPKYWIMENVPRVGLHLPERIPLRWIGVNQDGWLETPVKQEFLMSEYGAPQNRKRLLIGNYPIPKPTHSNELSLFSESLRLPPSLGDVVTALAKTHVIDPNYNISLPALDLSDHTKLYLDKEEIHRIREVKTNHPYMGWMPFPDRLDKPARTVVSLQMGRETLVIQEEKKYRRATVRECATLQTFPINFHFFGSSIESRYKQAGNAVPPILPYRISQEISRKERLNSPLMPIFHESEKPPIPTVRKKKAKKVNLEKSRKILFPGKEIRGFRIELTSNPKTHQWTAVIHEGEGKLLQRTFNSDTIIAYSEMLIREAGLQSVYEKIISAIENTQAPSAKELHEHCHLSPMTPHDYIQNAIASINTLMPKSKYHKSISHLDNTYFSRQTIRTRLLVSLAVSHRITLAVNRACRVRAEQVWEGNGG